MYDYLEGKLVIRKPTYVVLDVNGVGYNITIPISTYEKLRDSGAVKLFTYLKVSEDEMKLYGFISDRERQVFLQLVNSVNRLGPSKAIAILSNVSIDELVKAVEEGDTNFLQRIKGIGNKIAQRLVIELKGKLPYLPSVDVGGVGGRALDKMRDAVQALVSLGYERSEADEAVRRAQKECGNDGTLEDIIKKSLEYV